MCVEKSRRQAECLSLTCPGAVGTKMSPLLEGPQQGLMSSSRRYPNVITKNN